QPIQNSGNPGAFDYSRYCLFQGITHQVYLVPTDIFELPGKTTHPFKTFIFACRQWVVKTLQHWIPGKKEQGLAEALLIGYKDDLDKNLVQSYSNTGVVHVIAISGLHLGLIYGLLLLLTRPIKKYRQFSWLRLLIVIAALWIFSILAGAQPSVLRSAVMFTFLAYGEVINRKASIYNTMALSAFMLLCYQPYWLWDAGFQLSYAAVLSIIIFFKPVYNWFYFKNKLADAIWKLNAVTISAQLLTMPVSIYHFNQLPTLFIFTNLVAVPLSSLILVGEILLCAFSFIGFFAQWLGYLLHWSIFLMNSYIEQFDLVSYSVWGGLSISFFQAILLMAFIIFFCCWLMEKISSLLWLSLLSLLIFVGLRSVSFIETSRQQKLIVYNIPKLTAIEVVRGRNFQFIGNALDPLTINFHLRPSRILHRTSEEISTLPASFKFSGKQFLVIDSAYQWKELTHKIWIDVLVLSGNPKIYITDLARAFEIKQIVIDGSVPAWKAAFWKKDCSTAGIACFDVSEKGAFVMNL
ncbi:MAG: ComEC/Rec2 family competence protein, partial [Flavisolibacter sp.]